MTMEEVKVRGWDYIDFVFITGDAYVDHPSFGSAVIARTLEAFGYRVAIIAQPDWTDEKSVTIFGQPRLGFLINGGNMDSMVNHYTVSKKRRHSDAYTPNGEIGKRPDRATIVYGNLIRKTYKKTPIILGGIEASLRRLAHYDYWSDKIKRSILLDSGADILVYGMGEKAIVQIADALSSGLDVSDITFVKGTVYKSKEAPEDALELPDFEQVKSDKKTYAKSFYLQYQNTDSITAKTLYEQYSKGVFVVQNPPMEPLTTLEFDDVYSYPYTRSPHPIYDKIGEIPALSEIKFSITSNRGCFGGCNFCALTFHQGRRVQARSHKSIIDEAIEMTKDPDFKGYISDVGGPTADFRKPSCKKQLKHGVCKNKQCLFPTACKNLEVTHEDYTKLLKELRNIPKVKKVFVRSGVRFDYVVYDKKRDFMKELVKYHVSGQLRVAPEHVSDNVLKRMGKPSNKIYEKFKKIFEEEDKLANKDQYIVPYLMSSHPGSTLEDAIALAEAVRDMGYMPEQVQDFYPTPSTISTCMYYTGLNPETVEEVYVPKSFHEKAMQRALIQYRDPKNYDLVKEALLKAGRKDLIGFEKHCLIKPRKMSKDKIANDNKSKKTNDKNKAKKVSSNKRDNKGREQRNTFSKYRKKK
ncbi:MAG: YgiQ family radical SAM protein [Lachnospiraceae bacterium]|nr:YgiQ family radical SAM protein [Lachnospiraceae bacterium]